MVTVLGNPAAPFKGIRPGVHPSLVGPGELISNQNMRAGDGIDTVRNGTTLYLAAPATGTIVDLHSITLNGTCYLIGAFLVSSKVRLYWSTSGSAWREMTEVGGWSGGTDGDSRLATDSGRISVCAMTIPQGFVAGATLPSRDVALICSGENYNRIWDPGLANSSTVTVSSVADNGSGLIRCTMSTSHNRQTGDTAVLSGAVGAIANNLNGSWTVTKVSNTVFDLDGSTYVAGYTANSATMEERLALTILQPVTVPAGARAGLRAVHTFRRYWQCAGSAGTNKYGTGSLVNQSRWKFRDGSISPYASGSNVVPEWDATASAVSGDIATVRFATGINPLEAVSMVMEDQSTGSATFDDLIRNGRISLGTGDFGSYAAVSGAANNGAGLIRITATAHGFSTGNSVTISGVVGTTEANGTWTITVISANTFDLTGSTFTNAYVSGGDVVNGSVTWVELHDPADLDHGFPEKNVLADGIDNPSIDPPEVSMWTFKLGHWTAAQLAATYYHLKVERLAGTAPVDATTAMLLNVVTGGSAPGGSEIPISYEDAYGHSESSRLVPRNDEAAMLRDCGGPVTLYDYRFPISSSVLYDFDLWVKNSAGAASITGGLNGEPSRFNVFLRVPGETVALYWFSVILYAPGYVSNSRGWGKIDTNEYVYSAATSKVFNTADATATYSFDWTVRDPNRHAPSDYQIAMPRARSCLSKNGRVFLGDIKDPADQRQRGQVYYSRFLSPFHWQSIVEDEQSGGRMVAEGEQVQGFVSSAAGNQGLSHIHVVTDKWLYPLGGSGSEGNSPIDATLLSVLMPAVGRGTRAFRSICEKDGAIFYLDHTGQWVKFLGGVVEISYLAVDNFARELPTGRIAYVVSAIWQSRMYSGLTLAGDTANGVLLGWNDKLSLWEFDDLPPVEFERILTHYDSSLDGSGEMLLLATSAGVVYRYENGDYDLATNPIAVQITSGDLFAGMDLAEETESAQMAVTVDTVEVDADPQTIDPDGSGNHLTADRITRSPAGLYRTGLNLEEGWATDEDQAHTEVTPTGDGELSRTAQLDLYGDLEAGTRIYRVAVKLTGTSSHLAGAKDA